MTGPRQQLGQRWQRNEHLLRRRDLLFTSTSGMKPASPGCKPTVASHRAATDGVGQKR
jgi:hypothetical protein